MVPAKDPPTRPLLEPGRNCWRKVRADRFSPIVDAASYFRHLKSAMLAARDSIILIGWDFDTRVRLDPEHEDPEWPNRLGAFINKLVERRPALRVHILKWDLGMVATLGRGATPLFVLDWITSERINFRLDRVHPVGASHHQKIAVIDDVLAFCGGIDVTVGRWDTREHKDDDPRRTSPFGFRQPPWHDVTTAVSGEAAKALGVLARQRWRHATKEDLPGANADARPIWPDDLGVTFEDVEVGIARTQPEHDGEAEVREIETLYLDGIRRARKLLYFESQYFASHKVAEALADRLEEKDGPEIVVINPQSASGWLEEEVMGSARSLLLRDLKAADRHDRFRIFHPVAAGGTPIYVHAKIMIVDDVVLRVGSSNLNNRSMGLDTECDLALEATGSDGDALAGRIRALRHDFLAEHLGIESDDVRIEEKAAGSLVQAIETLRRPGGRSLRPVQPQKLTDVEVAIARKRLLDPERPQPPVPHLRRMLGEIQRLRRRSSTVSP
jgi:phospholipase D1/2